MTEKENIISEEDAAVIEEMQNAKAAPEPGMAGLKAGVEDSGRDLPIDGRPQIKWIGSAGYVYVWDNRTGERSTINRNMLKTQLDKKRPDGSRVFTTVDPKIPVKRGNLKCMLHAKDPNRAHYDELGLPVCRKDNLTSVYQVKRHMQKRHPQEWATIQEEITRKEKEEDMELRRAVLQSAGKAKSKEA